MFALGYLISSVIVLMICVKYEQQLPNDTVPLMMVHLCFAAGVMVGVLI